MKQPRRAPCQHRRLRQPSPGACPDARALVPGAWRAREVVLRAFAWCGASSHGFFSQFVGLRRVVATSRFGYVFPRHRSRFGRSEVSEAVSASLSGSAGPASSRFGHTARRLRRPRAPCLLPVLAARQRLACAEPLPNPSLKRSANGRPPRPGRRYAVHFRQPGLGGLPLSSA